MTEQPPEDQPVVPMRDLDPAEEAGPPAISLRGSVSSNRLLAAALFALAGVAVVVVLLVPLYSFGGSSQPPGFGGGDPELSGLSFDVTPWGVVQPSGFGVGFELVRGLVGPAPYWGVPLLVLTVLLFGAVAALVWGSQRLARVAALGVAALLFGCAVTVITFVTGVFGYYQLLGAGLRGVAGPGLWVLGVAAVLAVVAAVFGYRDRLADQPVPREEPDTPALGLPLPGFHEPEED